MEVQLQIFSERMLYEREKDRRTYDQALAVNENARLSILKQGEMVTCLANLSGVLSRGLMMTNGHGVSNVPQTARGDDTTSQPLCSAVPVPNSAEICSQQTQPHQHGSDKTL